MMTESMKIARRCFKKWKVENPDASMHTTLRRMIKTSKKGFQMEFGLHTLLSIIVPMPEESVRRIEDKINKIKVKYG